MTASLCDADLRTPLKIVVISLVAAVGVMTVSIAAHVKPIIGA